MKNYIWKSAFASLINQYIEMKHLAGLKFIDQEVHLQHFDHYLYYSGYEGTALTKDILFPFIYDQGESEYTMHTKENLFLDFSKYIVGKGHYAYTFAPIYKFHSNHYVPHIYTRDERKKFLQAVDNYPVRNCSNRHIMDPVFFRIIIGTGCRLSEVLHLKISDYDRSAGAIRVMHSKNYRSRIVPLCDSLNKRVCEYIDTFHAGSDEDTYLFPGKNGSLSTTAAYIHFRDYLFLAGIPHTGDGPRIHDFRHTLAVENLRRWSQQRKDLPILLPYLAAYMGHVDTSATQYYLRLTAEIYPELLEQMEDACLNIIPEGGYTGEE
jgi:integrase